MIKNHYMLLLRDEVWGVQTLGKQQLCATLYTTECYKDLCWEGRAQKDQDRFQPALMGQSFFTHLGHQATKRSLCWCSGPAEGLQKNKFHTHRSPASLNLSK